MKMRLLLFMFFVNALASVAQADDVACYRLLEAAWAKVSVSTMINKVAAGNSVEIRLAWDVADTTVLEPWDDVELSPWFSNRILGSAILFSSYHMKSQGIVHPLASTISMSTPANVVGLYDLGGVRLRALKGGKVKCYQERLLPATSVQFLVENELNRVDIYPPALTKFRFEPSSVRAGETARLIFKAEDKNAICTKRQESQGHCIGYWHQSIVSDFKTMTFDGALEEVGGGEYVFTLSIPREALAGTYRLNQVYVRDVLGNFVVSPQASDSLVLTVIDR